MLQVAEFSHSEDERWPLGKVETAVLIRTFDWAHTPLGAVSAWPQSRKTVVDLILRSGFPMMTLWGKDLFLIYNEACVGILGARHPDAMGRPSRDAWPDAWHRYGPLFERAFNGEAVSLDNQRLPVTRAGASVEACFSIYCSPLRDEGGSIDGILVSLFETPQRQQVGAGPYDGDHRYRELLEAMPQIVWSADLDGNVDFFNSRWFAYTGLSEEQSYAGEWETIIHPDDRTQILREWAEAIKSGSPIDFEHRLRRGDGVYRWHMGRAVPVRDEQGDVLRWFGTFTDIDDRKRAEDALRESEQRFRQFAENSTSVLWVLDTGTNQIEYLSPSFQQIWGGTAKEVPRDFGQWLDSVHPDDRENLTSAFNRVLEEADVVVKEYRVVRPDGGVRWIQNTCFPILDESGRVRRLAGIAQDITQHDGSMVYIVDRNGDSRRALSLELQGAGYQVKTFDSGQAFLEVAPVLIPGCVVIAIQSPDLDELTIPRELKARRVGLPAVVLGRAHGDVAFGVRAMKAGAVDFLDVPHSPERLLESVASALATIREIAERDQAGEIAKARIATLSAREREVLDGLLTGGTNKTIARDLDISPRTVEAHRARIMERLEAESLPELVQIAIAAGLKQPV
jgi:PAS domain S-box-containing protein